MRGVGCLLSLAALAVCGCKAPRAVEQAGAPVSSTAPALASLGALAAPPVRWLKGQLHLHSWNSVDSRTSPADVVRWYGEHGYDFLVFTDHNHAGAPRSTGSVLVLPGVELTQNLADCSPAAEPGERCLLHVNGLFLDRSPGRAIPWRLEASGSRSDLYVKALTAAHAMGGIAQLNHPNFHHAANAGLIAILVREHGLRLFEVANGSFDAGNGGDARHPSTESIWDQLLTDGAFVFGTATDDAHHYYDARAAKSRGEQVFAGDRGFVMVRSALDGAAIRAALLRGDFYASSGVLLQRADVTNGTLAIDVAASAVGAHRFAVIGTGGRVLMRLEGRSLRFPLASVPAGYVRVVVEDVTGRRAWLQPVRIPAS